MPINVLYRKFCGVELGTILLLLLTAVLLDPSLYTICGAVGLSTAVAVCVGAALYRWAAPDGTLRTLAVSSASAGAPGGLRAADRGGVAAGRRRLQLVGVRLIEGRLELFHVLVTREQDSWLVWRSKEQLFDLRKRLCAAVPDVSVPQLPSALSNSAVVVASNDDSAAQSSALRRHQQLVCAWLEVLNDSPVLRDRPELAAFLDDLDRGARAAPPEPGDNSVSRGPHISRKHPQLSKSTSLGNETFSSTKNNSLAASEQSAMKRLKSLFKRKPDLKRGELEDQMDISSIRDNEYSPDSGLVEDTEDGEDTYEKWLRQKQQELRFSGDSFETLEFTDISPEQRAQFKDSGSQNGFKLRGQTYKNDGKKVPAGQPLSRLIGMESYRVDVSVEGKDADGKDMDRHDHVATRGVCRRRIEAVLCLRDPPFLFVMNFQLPGDPPVSMVSYFAIPAYLARGMGTVSSVPEKFRCSAEASDGENEESISADVLKAMALFKLFCDFPRDEYERLALWGIEGSEEHKMESRDVVGEPKKTDVDNDGSVCSDHTGTTGAWSTSQRSGADLSTSQYSGDRDPESSGSRRYQKALRKEAEAREKERISKGGAGVGAAVSSTDHSSDKAKKKSLLQRLGLSAPGKAAAADETNPAKLTHVERAKSDSFTASTNALPKSDSKIEEAVSIERNSIDVDGNSVASERSGASKKSSASRSSKSSSKAGWKMPSDICWADPHEKGIFPPEDVRNTRFKLTPLIVDGPWVVKAAVPTQPAILGQKVVIRYFRGNGYIEADIHVGSSIIASQVVGLLRGYAKHFVSEVGVTLQGENEQELPEKLFASILLVHPDPAVNRSLDEDGII